MSERQGREILLVSFSFFVRALYFTVRDRNLGETVKNHWPLLAFSHSFIPNIPRPLDEVFVAGIAICLEGYFLIQRGRLVGSKNRVRNSSDSLLKEP